jgi:hypothetical protein
MGKKAERSEFLSGDIQSQLLFLRSQIVCGGPLKE